MAAEVDGAGRIVLVGVSPRVAPGLLSWPAWQELHAARHVVTTTADHPQRGAVEAAGAAVQVIAAGSARALADALVELAKDGGVCLLCGPEIDDGGLSTALAMALEPLAERAAAPEVEVVGGSYDLPGGRLLDLVAVMDRLRSPGGCPWDAAQTHSSLVPYLIEEAYETVEAVETRDRDLLREELGDLLLQVVFHARLGEEDTEAPWSVDDVAAGIVDKLVRRHPHVFADGAASSPAELEASWEQLKHAEKGRASAMDGVPLAQPALALAAKLLGRAERAEVEAGVRPVELAAPTDEAALGDLLLGVVQAARAAGLDAEAALRDAARRLVERVRTAERAERAGTASPDGQEPSA